MPKPAGRLPPPAPPAKRAREAQAPASTFRASNHKQAAGLAAALSAHRFRNTGVETKVTSRADVEAAFAKIQPGRVRRANEQWAIAYSESVLELGGGGDEGAPAGTVERRRQPLAVRFADGAEGAQALAEVFEFGVPGGPCRPRGLGAAVSGRYRETLAARLLAAEGGPAWPLLAEGHDPDEVWRSIGGSQVFQEPTSVFRAGGPLPARALGSVRFVCISDTHGRHDDLSPLLPEGDVLLHAGDFTSCGDLGQLRCFGSWLGSLPYRRKLVVAGNHDVTLHEEYYLATGKRRFHAQAPLDPALARAAFLEACGDSVTFLEDEAAVVEGVRVYGSPWQPEFADWAFGLPRGPALAHKWAAIPDDTDVLLTHGPPLGRGDLCSGGNRAGCADLLSRVQGQVRPRFSVFGHIHEGHGVTFDGVTHFVNAASSSLANRCENVPLVFDVVPGG